MSRCIGCIAGTAPMQSVLGIRESARRETLFTLATVKRHGMEQVIRLLCPRCRASMDHASQCLADPYGGDKAS